MSMSVFFLDIIYGDNITLLIKCKVIFNCSHTSPLNFLIIRYKVQVSIEDDADAGEDVNARRVFALLNTGEVSGIYACEKRKVTGFHSLGFSEFLNSSANPNPFRLAVA